MTLVSNDRKLFKVDKKEDIEDMALSAELLAFMKNMQVSVDKISKDIIASKADLKSDINDGRREVKEELFAMNKKINAINDIVEKNKENDDRRMNRMEKRMEEFDRERKNLELQARKRKEISVGSVAKEATTEEAKVTKNVEERQQQQQQQQRSFKAGSEELYSDKARRGRVDTRDTTEELVPEVEVFKSAWARQFSQVNLEEQLIAATEAAARIDNSNVKKQPKVTPPAKLLKMGESLELHSQQDWHWEESDSDWENTIDKREKNKDKKRKAKEKKQAKVAKAVKVAKCTIGVGPIATESIDYFNVITADYNEAKRMAATEFLMGYLKYNHEDMEDLTITDTKISAKGDGILYLVLDHPDKVRNIRRRIADVQNKDVKTREFIPPYFFNRYTALGRHAQALRAANADIKTQIRFEETDIELYTKERGVDGPFQPAGIHEVASKVDLPPIDYNAKWRRNEDRPAWRSVSPQRQKVTLKSLAGRPSSQKEHSPDREPVSKKSKHEMNAESSSSSDTDTDNEPESPAKKQQEDAVPMNTTN